MVRRPRPSGVSDQGSDARGARAGRTDADVSEGGSGRRYLAGAAATVVAFVAVAGYVVAANNQVDTVTVFDVVTLSGTPAGVAAYGAALAAGVLAVLFGLVTLASRYDGAERR